MTELSKWIELEWSNSGLPVQMSTQLWLPRQGPPANGFAGRMLSDATVGCRNGRKFLRDRPYPPAYPPAPASRPYQAAPWNPLI